MGVINALAEGLAKSTQSVQSGIDYIKEFLQFLQLLSLDIFLIAGYILYIALFFFIARISVAIYSKYKDNIDTFKKILFSRPKIK